MRRQFFQFTTGQRQYQHLQPQESRVGFRVSDLLQAAEAFAVGDSSALISEIHLAEALAKRLPHALVPLGIRPRVLIDRVGEIEGVTVEAMCFVLMPFRHDLTEVYRSAIKPAVEAVGLRCERADEITRPGVILDQIDERTQRAQIIVADLTGANPNVTQEIGYARALDKQIILLTQQTKELPFDVRHYRVLAYRPDPPSLEKLKEQLRLALAEILR